MGLLRSCAFTTCTDLETCLSSIGFLEDDQAKSLVTSINFKNQDSEPDVIKYVSSQKVRAQDPFRLKNANKNETCSEPSPKHEAATKLQKVYKSFRTRRKLADCAVLIEQNWWKVLDYAELQRSSISFFHIDQHESAISRWARAKTRAAKVGKGLSKNCKAQKLALQHWLEAIDPRHRYGHNLHFYYIKWLHSQSKEPFFYWLDIGEGKEVNLVEKCPRLKLQQQCIKYLGPMERKTYEVAIENGKLFHKQTGDLIDTTSQTKGSKWIFVLSTINTLYIGIKKKGSFQHSSFLSGGATLAAGRIIAEKGVLKAIWPHSGHYHPTLENFQNFISFLHENEVDTSNVKMGINDDDGIKEYFEKQSIIVHIRAHASKEDDTSYKPVNEKRNPGLFNSLTTNLRVLEIPKKDELLVNFENQIKETMQDCYSDDDHEHEETKSFQLGRQISCKWSTGAGPRIGCLRDYPSELQSHALEQAKLSPRRNIHSYRTKYLRIDESSCIR